MHDATEVHLSEDVVAVLNGANLVYRIGPP